MTGEIIHGVALSKKVGEISGTYLMLGWLPLLTGGTSAMLTHGLLYVEHPLVGHSLVELMVKFVLFLLLRIVVLFARLS